MTWGWWARPKHQRRVEFEIVEGTGVTVSFNSSGMWRVATRRAAGMPVRRERYPRMVFSQQEGGDVHLARLVTAMESSSYVFELVSDDLIYQSLADYRLEQGQYFRVAKDRFLMRMRRFWAAWKFARRW